ncbi:MAG: CdaR family protein [Planctomycetota bacterium]|nr:CdaR family protein [Planctomycetota bacterium]
MAAPAGIGYWLRRAFGADGILAAVSVALATLLWLYVNDELSAEREIVAPLKIQIPENMAVGSGPPPAGVRIRVRGPKRKVELIGPMEIQGVYRVPDGAPPGPFAVNLDAGNFSTPPEVSITRVVEDRILIELTQTSGRPLRVKPVIAGSPKDGFEIDGSPAAVPSEVTVTGPSEDLKNAEYIETEPVDVGGMSEGFSRRVALARFVKVGDRPVPVQCAETVEISVRIRERTIPRVFQGIWVRALVPAGVTARVSIKPPQVNVKAVGERRRVTQLRPEDIRLYVDLSDVAGEGSRQATLPILVVPIPGVTVSGEAGALPPVAVEATFAPAPGTESK